MELMSQLSTPMENDFIREEQARMENDFKDVPVLADADATPEIKEEKTPLNIDLSINVNAEDVVDQPPPVPIQVLETVVDIVNTSAGEMETISRNQAEPKIDNTKLFCSVLFRGLKSCYQNLRPFTSLRGAFEAWKLYITSLRSLEYLNALEEANKTNAGLEQRVAKLKGLLARTYQSNQRSIEDSNSMKVKAQETAEELRSLKLREEYERRLLEEDLRRQAMESAFHYDVEMMIQRAADGVVSQQGTWAQSQQVTSKRVKELETERELLRAEIERCKSVLAESREQLAVWEHSCREHREEADRLREVHSQAVLREQEALRVLAEERQLRRDLEVELDALIAVRSGLASDIEGSVAQRFERQVLELGEQISALRSQLDQADRRARAAETQVEKLQAEVEALRGFSRQSIQYQTQIDQLEELVAELKRRLAVSGSGQSLSQSLSLPSPSAVSRIAEGSLEGAAGEVPVRSSAVVQPPALPDIHREDYVRLPGGKKALDELMATAICVAGERVSLEMQRALLEKELQRMVVATESQTLQGKFLLLCQWGDRVVELTARCMGPFLDLSTIFDGGSGQDPSRVAVTAILDSDNIILNYPSRASPAVAVSVSEVVEDKSDLLEYEGQSVDPAHPHDDPLIAAHRPAPVNSAANGGAGEGMSGSSQSQLALKPSTLLVDKSALSRKGHVLSGRREELKRLVTELRAADVQDMSWEAASVAVQAGRDFVLKIPIPNTARLAFLEWQYSADPYDFVSLRLVRARAGGQGHTELDSASAGEGLQLQSEMSPNTSNPDALPVFSGTVAVRANGDHRLHICNGAMWGSCNVAYVIRLRFEGEELHAIKLREAERELNSVDQELLQLRLAIRRGKELGQQMHGVVTAYHLAKKGRLQLSAHLARQEHIQRQQQQEASQDTNRIKEQQRLAEARAQLKRLRDLARHTSRQPKVRERSAPSVFLSEVTLLASSQQKSKGNGAVDDGSGQQVVSEEQPPSMPPPSDESPLRNQVQVSPTRMKRLRREEPIVYSAESISIRPAADLRLPLMGQDSTNNSRRRYVIRWDWSVLHPANTDIGFAVLEQLPNGFLKQIVPYKRAKWGGGPPGADAGGHISVWRGAEEEHCHPIHILLDNSYSWLTPKIVRYSVTIERLQDDSELETEPMTATSAETGGDGDITTEHKANGAMSEFTSLAAEKGEVRAEVLDGTSVRPGEEAGAKTAGEAGETKDEEEDILDVVPDGVYEVSLDHQLESDFAIQSAAAADRDMLDSLSQSIQQLEAITPDLIAMSSDATDFALQHGSILLAEDSA